MGKSAARPEIFVSASSGDLADCRQLIKDGLLAIGCLPIEQSSFPPDARSVKEMLRARLAHCDAMIHVVGFRYGAEPSEREPGEARRSYTQLEYDLARELKIPVYVFLCGEDFPFSECEPEAAELAALQRVHRAALSHGDLLFEEVSSSDELSKRVHALQARVEQLTRELQRTRSWMARGVLLGIFGLLGLTAGGWWLSERADQAEIRLGEMESLLDEQRGYVQGVADAYLQVKSELAELRLSDGELRDRALGVAAQQSGMPRAELAAAIDSFVASVSANPDASRFDQALARFAEGDFELAGDLAFLAADSARARQQAAAELKAQAEAAQQKAREQQRKSLLLAGDSRFAANRYREAVEAYLIALAPDVTSRDSEPEAWGEIQARLGLSYQWQSVTAAGIEVAVLLKASEVAFRQAMELAEQEGDAALLVRSQHELAMTFIQQIEVVEADERLALSQSAVALQRMALEGIDRKGQPRNEALARVQLGVALVGLAQISFGESRTAALVEAEELLYLAFTEELRRLDRDTWASAARALSLAYSTQAEDSQGEERARLLLQADQTQTTALAGLQPETECSSWCALMHLRAIQLTSRAEFADPVEAILLLTEAVEVLREQQEWMLRENDERDWAASRSSLGSALKNLASLRFDERKLRLLNEAKACFENSLEVFTRESNPVKWAGTNINLAGLLQAASIAEEKQRIERLQEADQRFRAGAEVVTLESGPMEWAMIQLNLAIVQSTIAYYSDGEVKARAVQLWSEALESCLQVYQEEQSPVPWGRVQSLKARQMIAAGELVSAEAVLQARSDAQVCFRLAEQVFSPETTPTDWLDLQTRIASNCLNLARSTLGEQSQSFFRESIRGYEGALQVATREALPDTWLRMMAELCYVNYEVAQQSHPADALLFSAAAVELQQAILGSQAREVAEYDWAVNQNYLAFYSAEYARRLDPEAALPVWEQTVAALESAAEHFTEESSPGTHATILGQLKNARAAIVALEAGN